MPVFDKEVLRPGVYHSPDGIVDVSPERLQAFHNSFQGMKAAGLNVPVPWDHKPLVPSYDRGAFSAKDNAGFVTDSRIEGGALIMSLDIPDVDDARKIGTTVRDVSPLVAGSFTDERGKKWDDSLPHVSLCIWPVMGEQQNFEPLQMARRLSLNHLRMADDMPRKKPPFASDADSDDGDDDSSNGNGGVDPDSEAVAASVREKSGQTPESAEEAQQQTTRGGAKLDQVVQALGTLGIVISPDVTAESFLDHLATAVLTHKSTLDGGEPDPTGMGSVVEEPMSAGMQALSKNDQTARIDVTDGVKRLSRELGAIKAAFGDEKKREYLRRFEGHFQRGALSPKRHDELKKELDTFRLSINGEGQVERSRFDDILDLLDDLPDGAVWSDKEKSQRMSRDARGEVVVHEPSLAGDTTEKQYEEAGDRLCKALGV